MPEAVPVARLPHGDEFRLVGSAVLDEPGRLTAVRQILPTDIHLNPAGRFPALLLVELMAQAAGLMLAGASGGVVAGIRRLHLHGAPRAGDRVEVEARLERSLGRIHQFACRARAGGADLAHGTILLRAL